ncbi:hypothetical protein FBY23_5098 [Nocardioides sp. SLBN-35]|nr:hypothetical protein FBY23_5098 [Nocardioides sp. SLBN-35]
MVVVVGLAGGLAACSDDAAEAESRSAPGPARNRIPDLKPAKALQRARKATRKLSDAQYAGTLAIPAGEHEYVVMDGTWHVARNGNCTMDGKAAGFGKLSARIIGEKTYLRANRNFLMRLIGLDETTAKLFHNDWVGGPSSDATLPFCDGRVFLGGQRLPSRCQAGKHKTIEKAPTLAFTCAGGRHALTVYVAITGKPVIMRLTGTNDQGPFELTMVAHDTGVPVKPPKPKAVVNGP